MEPGDLIDLITRRQSQRSFSSKPVESEKLLRCIEAARLSPSACNAQPWKFIIVDDPLLKDAIAGQASAKLLGMNQFAGQAPVLVAVVREPANLSSGIGQVLKNKDYPLIDIGIATAHFCLQATAEGLSTCILGWFNEAGIRKLLGIPGSRRLELVILAGYSPDNRIRDKKRKPTGEILSFNRY